MHNIINKNFDRLTLPYKIILQNSKINPALFQLNYINKYFRIMKVKLHHYKLQVTLAQYFSKLSSFSKACHKPVWLTNDLIAAVPSENFHGFLID